MTRKNQKVDVFFITNILVSEFKNKGVCSVIIKLSIYLILVTAEAKKLTHFKKSVGSGLSFCIYQILQKERPFTSSLNSTCAATICVATIKFVHKD